MTKITYKVNGVELKASFEDMRDLTLFVAANMIKDEDLVSIDLGEGEITGGINGLADYTVKKITQEKEAEEQARKEAEERKASTTFNMVDLIDKEFEDKYLIVERVAHLDDDKVRVTFDSGESIIVNSEDRFYIVKDGDFYNPADLDDVDFTEIRVRAKYIHSGDVIINK